LLQDATDIGSCRQGRFGQRFQPALLGYIVHVSDDNMGEMNALG